MTKDDLRMIEQALDLRLPSSYADLMAGDEAGAARGEFWFRFLFNDPRIVIDRTVWLRDLMASYGLGFKQSFVVVSEVGGGDALIIDTAGLADDLLAWDHETNRVEPFGCTLSRFGLPDSDA